MGTYVNESSGNDHTRAKIFSNEESPLRHPNAFIPMSIYGKACTYTTDQSIKSHVRIQPWQSPNEEPIRMMKIAETRTPILPSKSFPAEHPVTTEVAAAVATAIGEATDEACRITICVARSRPDIMPCKRRVLRNQTICNRRDPMQSIYKSKKSKENPTQRRKWNTEREAKENPSKSVFSVLPKPQAHEPRSDV